MFLAAVSVALLAWAGQSLRAAFERRLADAAPMPPARERVYAVNVVTLTLEKIAPTLETFGEVRARRALEVRTPIGGTVVELGKGFEEGGTVTEGQLLLRVDPTDLQDALALARTDLDAAKADLADAEAAVEIARDDLASAEDQARLREQALERQRDLAARGAATEAAVENAAFA
ncbi:MAG: biotin/lipoyl-binding protein, partial [Alphaproteobacteria bacterium]